MLAAALLCPWAASAQAAQAWPAEAHTEQVAARLIAPVATVQAGQRLRLGLQQRIQEHWHTYWINPGDSGLATTIAWELPPGARAEPIEWPTPARFQLGPIVNYGYADEVTLLSWVQVPAGLREGDTFTVKATVDWLVCADTCIPQQVVLGLALPVRAAAPLPGADAASIEQAQARLPPPSPSAAQWRIEGQRLNLRLAAPQALPPHDAAYFYPEHPGRVAQALSQQLQQEGGEGWRLSLTAGESPPAAGEVPTGVLVLSRDGRPVQAYRLGGPPMPDARPDATPAAPPAPLGLWLALGLAALGGLVLNLMPCVFPVLSIKALSLLGSAHRSASSVRWHGLAYTAGVVLAFVSLASVLIALKAGGAGVGWGFQFQSPVFVGLLSLLMLGVGLSLSGVVTLGASVAGVGSALAARDGLAGSFFTGVLATVVATPCTAPFMGAALGYAVTQPAAVTLAVFTSLGLGLALPYLLLCLWPAAQRWLPRPGVWMEHVKQGLAFPMYGTAAWLVWVLAQQAGAQAVGAALACGVALAFAAWLYGTTRPWPLKPARWAAGVAGLAAAASVAGMALLIPDGAADTATRQRPPTAAAALGEGWEPYSAERLQALRATGKPVFVNLTAAWCLTCLVNERVALHADRVEAAFVAAGVARLKGDWTRRDARITALLAEHGRDGVPLYLLYPEGAGRAPAVLPQLLSADGVLAALDAARSSPAAAP